MELVLHCLVYTGTYTNESKLRCCQSRFDPSLFFICSLHKKSLQVFLLPLTSPMELLRLMWLCNTSELPCRGIQSSETPSRQSQVFSLHQKSLHLTEHDVQRAPSCVQMDGLAAGRTPMTGTVVVAGHPGLMSGLNPNHQW